MDAITAQKYKHRLVAERDALLAQIDAQRGGPISRADAASEALDKSEDDNAQIQSGRDVAFAINEHETAELLDIEAALLRIQNIPSDHPTDPQLIALARKYFVKFDKMAGDPSLL